MCSRATGRGAEISRASSMGTSAATMVATQASGRHVDGVSDGAKQGLYNQVFASQLSLYKQGVYNQVFEVFASQLSVYK